MIILYKKRKKIFLYSACALTTILDVPGSSQVIKEICQNSSSADFLGIKYGLLEWDLHKRNADIVCKEYGYDNTDSD